jgi:23S rRNA pseudoU1915 N3-methylase RlmH
MIKRLLTSLLIFTSLYAEESEEVQPLDPDVVQSLYIESALFVAVFALMSIISIVISKKHAAQNLLNDRKKREERKAQEEAEKRSQPVSIEKPGETARVTELSKMLKDGLITDDEFKILSKASKVKSD